MVVELTDRGHHIIPALKALWRELAAETVANLSSTSPEQVIVALTDLAASLQAADNAGRQAAGPPRPG